MAKPIIGNPTGAKILRITRDVEAVAGKPEIFEQGRGILAFAKVNRGANTVHQLVYKADTAVVNAQDDNATIAPEIFRPFANLFYDGEMRKFQTTANDATVLCGRVLDYKDYTGGVALNDTLAFELSPDVTPAA